MEYIDGRSMEESPEDAFLIGRLAKKLHSYTGYSVKSSMSQSTKCFYEWFSERGFKDSLPNFSEYDQCLIHSDIGPHNVMLRNNGDSYAILWTGCGRSFVEYFDIWNETERSVMEKTAKKSSSCNKSKLRITES